MPYVLSTPALPRDLRQNIRLYGYAGGIALASASCAPSLQLSTIERIERALALFLVIAWRIARLMRLGCTLPDLDVALLLEPEEWQAATKPWPTDATQGCSRKRVKKFTCAASRVAGRHMSSANSALLAVTWAL